MAIVSFILYRFLLIIQGTRAVQMIAGIAALFTLYWLSLYYAMYSLNWILNHFFDYIFVIVIILFQEQIKSALASFGETGRFFSKKGFYLPAHVEEIVSAAMALSRERIGALIVFEKQHGLLNYANTGTLLESNVHSDIIYAIFQTSSPLHDGAIIIHGDQIKSAGCFLPLSKNVEIDRHFGTRHRAAIGLSEVSDAVVLIVSEESGKINLSAAGNMIKIDNEGHLRSQLKLLLTTDTGSFVVAGKGARV